jgi:aquaporin Z
MLTKKLVGEFVGTFWLVLAGCGSAVLAGSFPQWGIGFLGISLAFGLSLLTMVYAIGPISGCHVNPAVSVAMAVDGRMSLGDLAAYVLAQVSGALVGSAFLFAIASGKPGFDVAAGFAANGYGPHSPGGYSVAAAFAAEAVLTFFFAFVILAVTSDPEDRGFAPLAIGVALAVVHLIDIPITNASVNPARSTGPALFVGRWAVKQLWLFWVSPILGSVMAAVFFRTMSRAGHPADIESRSSSASLRTSTAPRSP